MTTQLSGAKAELRATVTITRAATGLTEQVEIVGVTSLEQAKALGLIPTTEESSDVRHPLDGSA